MTGRVAVLQEYGGDFALREYSVPEVEPDAILARQVSSTSGFQRGDFFTPQHPPGAGVAVRPLYILRQ